jgi:hypothetical protein
MYRLATGKFEGMTLEHAILKSPPKFMAEVSGRIGELHRKPRLAELARELLGPRI